MILRYIRFMRRRIIACIDSRGDHTKYCLKKLQELKEKPTFNVTLVLEYFFNLRVYKLLRQTITTTIR